MIVEPDFPDHWKTKLLIQLVAEARAELLSAIPAGTQPEPNREFGFLGEEPSLDPRRIQPEAAPLWIIRLWAHCHQRKAGRFPNMSATTLRVVCAAPLPPDRWRDILLQCEFIELDGVQLVVHDWEETNSKLVANWRNGPSGGRPKKPKDNPPETQLPENGNPAGTQRHPKHDATEPNGNPSRSDREIDRLKREIDTARGAREAGVSDSPSSNDKAAPRVSAELAGLLVETATKKITGAVGGHRRKLGDLAVRALWTLAEGGELEWKAEDWATLAWFYGLKPDEEDVDLRSRYRDADRLAGNLMTALERAHSFAKKRGWRPGADAGTKQDRNSEPPPEGWEAWLAETYPQASVPGSFWDLPGDIQDEFFLGEKEKGAGAQ